VLRSDPHLNRRRYAAGFSLFELVVVILLVAIVFTYAFNRYQHYPAAAERANFLAVNAQLKAVINLLMMEAIASGNWQRLEALEGSNPMDLMLEPPVNYHGRGESGAIDSLPGHSWFFDVEHGALVYRASAGAGLETLQEGQWQSADTLRFRLILVYGDENGEGKQRWQGLLLASETEFRWRGSAMPGIPPDAALSRGVL